MKPVVLDAFAEIESAHRQLMTRLVALETLARSCGDLAELADIAYMLREAGKLFEHSGVESRKLGSLIARLFYVLWSVDPDGPERVKTEHCYCTPDPKHHVYLPSPDDDFAEYKRVLTAFGVPEAIIDKKVVKLSYGAFGDYVTEMSRAGKPLPFEANAGKSYVEHRLGITKRRGLSRPGTNNTTAIGETRDEHRPEDDSPF